jgi:hypothetical protein
MNARHLTAACATLLLLSSPAFADTKPAATPVVKTAVLAKTTGLAPSSSSPLGLVPLTPATIDQYVNAVGGIQVAASFNASQAADVQDLELPLGLSMKAVSLEKGANVSLQASYSKKNGDKTATLDGIKLNTSGVDLGPQVDGMGLKLTSAEVHADGSLAVQLNSWIPALKINKIEKQPNGDLKITGPSWMPPVTITAAGDVLVGGKVSVFGHDFDLATKVGHLTPAVLADWPPKLSDLAALAAGADSSIKSTEPMMPMVQKLAGTLKWNVKANAANLPVTLEGKPIQSQETVALQGQANLAHGEITTIGSANTTHVEVDFGKQSLGDKTNGLTLTKGSVALDGKYSLDLPLADPTRHAVVKLDGTVGYEVDGQNVHLSLPSGATASVGEVDLSGNNGVHVALDGNTPSFAVDPGHYSLATKGPLHLSKIGPLGPVDATGTVTASGTTSVSPQGKVSVQGNAQGEETLTGSGMLVALQGQKAWWKSTFKPGAKLDVNLDQYAGAFQLPVDGKTAGFQGATSHGTVQIQGGLGGDSLSADGVTASAPLVNANLKATGSVQVSPAGTPSGSGTVVAGISLPQGAKVAVNENGVKVNTTIDPGSHVDLNANVTTTPGSAQPELVATTAPLNARSGPSMKNAILKTLPKGTPLTVLSRQGGWANVRAADGATFWVGAPYLTTTRPAGPTGGTVVTGKLTGALGATNGNGTAEGATVDMKGHVAAGITAPFSVRIGPDGTPVVDPKKTSATLPIKIALKRGTKISYGDQSVTIDDDVSYVQLTGNIAVDASGKPTQANLSNVDVALALGGAKAHVLGLTFNIPTIAMTHFKGNVSFSASGMSIHGNETATLGTTGFKVLDITF